MYEEITANKRKSILLVVLFFVLIGILGSLVGLLYGSVYFGLIIAMFIALIFFFIQFYTGDKLILKISGAREASKEEYAYLVNSVEALSIAAGVPKPDIYVIDDPALNAFATGRNPKTSKIVVTTGLMKKLNRLELEGVIAHEMSHIKNYDIRVMLVAITLVGVVTLLSDFFLRSAIFGAGSNRRSGGGGMMLAIIVIAIILRILAPIAAYMIHLAISRQREYLADASGALLTRYPEGLASALEKIKDDKTPSKRQINRVTASMYISNPLAGKKGMLTSWFSTHPDIDSRISKLRGM